MSEIGLFYRFGAAVAIGFLVGLQREYAHGGPDSEIFAGVRTFSLIGLVGCTSALVADEVDIPWAVLAILSFFMLLIAVQYWLNAQRGGIGLTTEVSAVLTFLIGALCYWGYLPLAAAIAVVTTVLLALKPEMHELAEQITREDVYATLKFGIITAIVLPVLPNENYGIPPLDVLNPYKIWLMVVFISGISFVGYVLIKWVGPRRGIGITGVLGGLVSSTPLTVSFSQRSQGQADLAKPFAFAITIAWALMFPRQLIEVAALNAELLGILVPSLVAASAVGVAYGLYLYFAQQTDKKSDIDVSNPFELGAAVQFGLIYAVILVASKAAQIYLGDAGIYVGSVVAGLADADAITLSLAELSNQTGGLDAQVAARGIVLAGVSNTVAKGVIAISIGSKALRKALLPGGILMAVTAVGIAFFL